MSLIQKIQNGEIRFMVLTTVHEPTGQMLSLGADFSTLKLPTAPYLLTVKEEQTILTLVPFTEDDSRESVVEIGENSVTLHAFYEDEDHESCKILLRDDGSVERVEFVDEPLYFRDLRLVQIVFLKDFAA